MAGQELVIAGGAEFYVEVAEGSGGPATIDDRLVPMSFDGVRATIEGVATELAAAWERVKPSEATVEFALKLTAKSGKLTGLIVEGGGEATLTVKLTWKSAVVASPP